MPIPSSMEIPIKMRMRPAGAIIEIYPSTVGGLSVELQSATASAAASSLWSSVIFPPTSAGGLWRVPFQIPDSTKTYYFKARYPAQAGYSAGPFTAIVAKKPGILPPRRPWDGTLRISTPLTQQGSMLPVPFAGSLFTASWGGIGAGQMFVGFSWASQTLYKPDGSTFTLPAPPTALSLAAGDLGQVAGGVRVATTLYARRGLVKDGHVYALSGEQSLLILLNDRLTVTSPTAVPGYDGWCVMVGLVSNAEYLQESGGTPYPIPFGTDYTEPAAHFSTAAAQYTSAWLGSMVYVDLNASTTYYFYPYYDLSLGFLRMAPYGDAVGDTAPSMVDANQSWSDGRISLSGSGMTVVVGAGGGSGSPTAGGSKLT